MKTNDIQVNNLGMLLIFVIIMTILFWIMSDRKSKNITKCFISIIGVLEISKMFEAISQYFKNKET
jgi:HJR/Mrr/RecB family endonuclease